MPKTEAKSPKTPEEVAAWELSVLAGYRDRIVEAIGEIRAIACVVDECHKFFPEGQYSGIEQEKIEAVEALLGMLWIVHRKVVNATEAAATP